MKPWCYNYMLNWGDRAIIFCDNAELTLVDNVLSWCIFPKQIAINVLSLFFFFFVRQ